MRRLLVTFMGLGLMGACTIPTGDEAGNARRHGTAEGDTRGLSTGHYADSRALHTAPDSRPSRPAERTPLDDLLEQAKGPLPLVEPAHESPPETDSIPDCSDVWESKTDTERRPVARVPGVALPEGKISLRPITGWASAAWPGASSVPDCPGVPQRGAEVLGRFPFHGPPSMAADDSWVYVTNSAHRRVLAFGAGAQVRVLARGQTDPSSLAAGEAGVFWLNYRWDLPDEGREPTRRHAFMVMRHHDAAGTCRLHESQIHSDVLAVHGDRVYWLDHHGRRIVSMSVNGGLPRTVATWTPARDADGKSETDVAADALLVDGDRLYWAVREGYQGAYELPVLRRVMSMSLDGEDPRTDQLFAATGRFLTVASGRAYVDLYRGIGVARPTNGAVKRLVGISSSITTLLADDHWLYALAELPLPGSGLPWRRPEPGGEILRMPLDGGEPCAVARVAFSPIAAALGGRRLYWLEYVPRVGTVRVMSTLLPSNDITPAGTEDMP